MSQQVKRIVVVGGVAGGASFAARMRRLDEQAEIIIIERGEHISFANCGLPYHVGETIKERDQLIIQTPQKFRDRFNIQVQTLTEVTAVDSVAKRLFLRTAAGAATTLDYDVLLLSPGSTPIRPPIPGIQNEKIFTLRNIPDMDRIKAQLDTHGARRAAVVGGGFIGLEMAENLRHRGLEVTLIEMADQVFVPMDKEMANLLHQHLTINGVRLMLGDGAKEFVDRADAGISLLLGSGAVVDADFVVLAIGVVADTKFLEGSGVQRTPRGAIVVDAHMRTSVADIYAVGDAIEVVDFVSGQKVQVPLAGPANRQGRIAADNVAGIDSSYKSTQGTAVCKLFDLTAAVTGLNEKSAKRYGIAALKSYTHSASHASYYPGAYPMSIKILFDEHKRTFLGAQIVGTAGVDKRIDVFATALRHGLTVDELTELELAYAPPFGSAKDPVNMAGFVAQNILDKRMDVVYAEELAGGVNAATQTLVDVRTPEEYEAGFIEGAVLIPLDDLRGRMGELDKAKEMIVYCQVGLRGYLASRILTQAGFRVRNLSGGYKTWSAFSARDYDATYLAPVNTPSCSSPAGEAEGGKRVVVDASAMQCPGPIMQLKKAVQGIKEGELVEMRATDQGFALDVPAWCARTGNSLVEIGLSEGVYKALVRKGGGGDVCAVGKSSANKKTMVVFSNDLDRAMAAFIIANGAASMGSEVTLFFTFWGLNLLRRDGAVKVKKSFMETMFAAMMPRGPKKTILSKMHMGGMGTLMMRNVMKQKHVMSLEQLVAAALASGVKLVACTMTMDIMGIKREELIEGVEFGGVAAYLDRADDASYNVFV